MGTEEVRQLHSPAAVTGLDVFADEIFPLVPVHAPAKGQLQRLCLSPLEWVTERSSGSLGSGPLCLQQKEIWAA